jgi:methionine synthase I (cobalamin-dependent)
LPISAGPLAELHTARGEHFPLIAYGNIGSPDETVAWINTDSESPYIYYEDSSHWPAKIIGGCCGTTPDRISKQAKAIR